MNCENSEQQNTSIKISNLNFRQWQVKVACIRCLNRTDQRFHEIIYYSSFSNERLCKFLFNILVYLFIVLATVFMQLIYIICAQLSIEDIKATFLIPSVISYCFFFVIYFMVAYRNSFIRSCKYISSYFDLPSYEKVVKLQEQGKLEVKYPKSSNQLPTYKQSSFLPTVQTV